MILNYCQACFVTPGVRFHTPLGNTCPRLRATAVLSPDTDYLYKDSFSTTYDFILYVYQLCSEIFVIQGVNVQNSARLVWKIVDKSLLHTYGS